MIVAIVILSILLAGAATFIFLLFKMLKNTFDIIETSLDMASGKPSTKFEEAYDGKYYPATVISQVKFNSDSKMIITDFSMYEEKKIVGFTIYTKESEREYIGAQGDDIPSEVLEDAFGTPIIFKDVVVYASWEGMWTWKSAD